MVDDPKVSEAEEPEQRAAGSLAWLWMLLALIAVAGFLTWLGLESEPTEVAVVEEEDSAEEEDVPMGAILVEKDSLAATKGLFENELVHVRNVEATGTLGERIFWGELGDRTEQVPILVRVDSIVEDFEPQPGAFYTVTGLVHPMSDSLADMWGAAGEFAGEGEQIQAAFTDYYIQASQIHPTREVDRSTPSDTAEDEGGDGEGEAEGDDAGTGDGGTGAAEADTATADAGASG